MGLLSKQAKHCDITAVLRKAKESNKPIRVTFLVPAHIEQRTQNPAVAQRAERRGWKTLTFESATLGFGYTGRIVTDVFAHTQASQLGVKKDWIITNIAGNRMKKKDDFTAAFKKAKELERFEVTFRIPREEKRSAVKPDLPGKLASFENMTGDNQRGRARKRRPSRSFELDQSAPDEGWHADENLDKVKKKHPTDPSFPMRPGAEEMVPAMVVNTAAKTDQIVAAVPVLGPILEVCQSKTPTLNKLFKLYDFSTRADESNKLGIFISEVVAKCKMNEIEAIKRIYRRFREYQRYKLRDARRGSGGTVIPLTLKFLAKKAFDIEL